MKIGIIGLGHVGSAMQEIFPEAIIYDKFKKIGDIKSINTCDLAFICVPTPQNNDGSCNTDIVDEIIETINPKLIVIRSTVPIGYTKKMITKTQKRIVFQPEYYGETVAHRFASLKSRDWITLGGDTEDLKLVVSAYQSVYTSDLKIYQTDSSTAELAKYMENSFLALKVSFCNEFYDIANSFNIDYNSLREAWLMDPRIGRSHTFVYDNNRGYGGSCLPKDVSSIINQSEGNDIDISLMKSVQEKNKLYILDNN